MVYVQHVFKAHPEQVFLRYFWLFLWLHSGLEIYKVIRLFLPKTCKFNTHNQEIFLYKSMPYVLFRADYIGNSLKVYYNSVKLYSALGHKTPMEFEKLLNIVYEFY